MLDQALCIGAVRRWCLPKNVLPEKQPLPPENPTLPPEKPPLPLEKSTVQPGNARISDSPLRSEFSTNLERRYGDANIFNL